jgi:hypothetical protein
LRQETPSRSRSFWSRPAPAALFAIAAALIGSATVRALYRAHAGRPLLSTGRAEWIWYSSRVPKPVSLRFYAVREFTLAGSPARATARVFVDREHILYVNGQRAGAGTQRPGDPLAVYEVARFLHSGANRIAIEAASSTGIGGILFWMDGAGPAGELLVSDGRWRVDRDAAALTGGARYRPMVWGRPPQYPWGYPPGSR